jgi:hypothetical protein
MFISMVTRRQGWRRSMFISMAAVFRVTIRIGQFGKGRVLYELDFDLTPGQSERFLAPKSALGMTGWHGLHRNETYLLENCPTIARYEERPLNDQRE